MKNPSLLLPVVVGTGAVLALYVCSSWFSSSSGGGLPARSAADANAPETVAAGGDAAARAPVRTAAAIAPLTGPTAPPPEGAVRRDLTPEERLPWGHVRAELAEMIPAVDDYERELMVDRATRWHADVPVEDGVPDFDCEQLNPNKKKLSAYDRMQLEAITRDYDETLEALGTISFDLLGASLDEYFENDGYEHYPADQDPPELPAPLGTSYFTRSMTIEYGGWKARVRFYSSEFPHFNEHLKEVQRIRGERLAAIHAYVAKI